MEITPDGILILADANGKNIGDGYVQFTSQEHAEQALLKHKETIDKRYIEGFGSAFWNSFQQTELLFMQIYCIFTLIDNIANQSERPYNPHTPD